MPKSSNQKLKLLYLRRILLEETDDNHHLNAEQLVSKLEQLGINADRKTIYADVAALQDYGMDIFSPARSGRRLQRFLTRVRTPRAQAARRRDPVLTVYHGKEKPRADRQD